MDLLVQTNTVKLLRQVFDRKVSTSPCIPFTAGKPEFVQRETAQRFVRRTPESQGISSDVLIRFLEDIRADQSLDMHTLMILRNGAVILQASFGAYRSDVWQLTHSLSKSITGTAIGMLVDEGRLSLDDHITKIFEKRCSPLTLMLQKNLTVRHLLTMSSGVSFNEAGAVTESDWIRGYLEGGLKFEPGRSFDYNSMNTYMLSAIVHEITGQGLVEYLADRLFSPLGIENFHWERCPKGIEKGGWGLYLLPEDMAKVGQLYLQQGVWNGRRLISEAWVRQATSAQIQTPRKLGGFNYGYQIWVGRKQPSFLFNGMLGQNVLMLPQTGVIVVSTAGNGELFQKDHFFDLLALYFGPGFSPSDQPLDENPSGQRRLKATVQSLRQAPVVPYPLLAGKPRRNRRPERGRLFFPGHKIHLPPECEALDGRFVIVDKKARGSSVGLYPMYAQLMQNNYTHGTQSIHFDILGDMFVVTFFEKDEQHRISVGFGSPRYSRLSFHGEPHLVGTVGEFTQNEDKVPMLKLRISFIEMPCSRLVKFYFYGDDIFVEMKETPGKDILLTGVGSMMRDFSKSRLLEALFTRVDLDYLTYKIEQAFEPEIWGKLSAKDEVFPTSLPPFSAQPMTGLTEP